MKEVLRRLAEGAPLDPEEVERAVGLIMDGEVTLAQTGAFLMALRVRGETVEELVAAARAVRARAVTVNVSGRLVDTCGTGGDGLGTFNVSTAAALVAAAGGAIVAKHGNRAVSGRVGAADILEAAGARLELSPAQAERSLERFGFAFLFAPIFHPAFKHVAGPRREIGVRTLFNLLGPLCNPAGVRRQLLGLSDPSWLERVAEALRELGSEHVLVVHGADGSDEITLTGPTDVVELRFGSIRRFRIDPDDLGLESCRAEDLIGGDAEANATVLRVLLAGGRGPLADVVAANAGAALYVAGRAVSILDGVGLARGIITEGRAESLLEEYIRFSKATS